jgi:hypothetical protein
MKLFQKSHLILLPVLALACIAIQAQRPTSAIKPAVLVEPENNNTPIGCAVNCLWYSGDFDSANANANGLWNANSAGSETAMQVWVPFIPAPLGASTFNAVKISSITFNELTLSAPTVESMSFEINSGMAVGNAGHTVITGACTFSNPVATGRSFSEKTEYAFTCTLPTPVTLKISTLYWVNLLPTLAGNNVAYLSNAIDSPERRHSGWGNVFDEAFFYSSSLEENYVNTTTQGAGLTEFSVAITGKYAFVALN